MVKPVRFRDRPLLIDIQSGDRFPVSRMEAGVAKTYAVDYDVMIAEVLAAVTENRLDLTMSIQQQQAILSAAITALNNQATMIQQTDAAMQTATSSLAQRISALETGQSAIAGRVSTLESSQQTQDAAIVAAKGRLDSQETALVSAAMKNVAQDQRLTDLETWKTATVTKLTDLTAAITAINTALAGKPSLVDLGTWPVGQQAIGIPLVAGARTVELTGVTGLLKDDRCMLFILPTTANPNGVPNGYTVAAHPVAKANGVLEVQIVAPALALLASYSISCRLYALR